RSAHRSATRRLGPRPSAGRPRCPRADRSAARSWSHPTRRGTRRGRPPEPRRWWQATRPSPRGGTRTRAAPTGRRRPPRCRSRGPRPLVLEDRVHDEVVEPLRAAFAPALDPLADEPEAFGDRRAPRVFPPAPDRAPVPADA